MSSLKEKEFLITFQELKCLDISDISTVINRYEALSICEKSTADSIEIFQLWVRKVFPAYDIQKYTKNDWLQILAFLKNLLNKFLNTIRPLKNDILLKQLNQWWTDTLELVKYLEKIIHQIDAEILASVISFISKIIIKTSGLINKKNIEPIMMLHKKLLDFLKNNFLKGGIVSTEDLKVYNEVLLTLCDVAAQMSSLDITIAIETWRSTAKLTNKCNDFYKHINTNDKENIKKLQIESSETTLRGMLNQLKKMFQHFTDDINALNNDNYLKVAHFYLVLIKIVCQNSDLTFIPTKEYIELCSTYMHHLVKKSEIKVKKYLENELFIILHITYERMEVEEILCDHLKHDIEMDNNCDLLMDYIQYYVENNGKCKVNMKNAINLFDIIFEGNFMFNENEKCLKIFSYFAILTAQDKTSELHEKWCNNLIEMSWIKSYASYEILKIFYSIYFKNNSSNNIVPCLEFWINCWQNVNNTCSTLHHLVPQRYLIEIILKSLVNLKPHNITLDHIFNKFPYSEILMLKCGQCSLNLQSYLNNNLTKYLQKIQAMNMERKEYNEFLNLLDIWSRLPQCVNANLHKDDLFKSFSTIFSLQLNEIPKFKTFFNITFCILKTIKFNEDYNNKILNFLKANRNKTESIASIFLIDYLKEQFDSNQIDSLFSIPEIKKLQIILNNIESNEEEEENNQYFPSNSCKRPRLLHDLDSSNCKVILNQMLDYSRQLSLRGTMALDENDMKTLRDIKENIQNCLLK